MGEIRLLSEKTINQIAAGEVVERPLSIIKELVENSIDAMADSILIEVFNGGKTRIIIKDNGCGMSEDDIFMSLERHATSKITSIDELSSLSTMGFRGEAIPSISAVTNFSISSATEHGQGFLIQSRNGKIIKNIPVSIPKGTEICAENLFHNIPARKKFLKSDEREFALIRELIQKFSITNPEIGFSLNHNDKLIFSYRKGLDIIERISSVWKIETNNISYSEFSADEVSLKAYVPSPFESVPATSVISVNGRIVSDRLINSGIYKTFKEVIGGEFKSPVVLFFETTPGFTDINVHPSKLEVRFVNPGLILNLINKALTSALNSFRNTPDIQPYKNNCDGIWAEKNNSDQPAFVFDNQSRYTPENESIYSIKLKNYKKIGIVFGVYQIIETQDNIIFLDLHASHERITFTSLKDKISLNNGLSQVLISPQIIRISATELSVFIEFYELFSSSGFLIDTFDENSVILRAVPAIGFETDWTGTIKEILGQIINEGSTDLLNEKFLYYLASTACKSSIKRNDFLADAEIDFLINDINNSNVLTCPHGRPFFFQITKNEFEKRVQRR